MATRDRRQTGTAALPSRPEPAGDASVRPSTAWPVPRASAWPISDGCAWPISDAGLRPGGDAGLRPISDAGPRLAGDAGVWPNDAGAWPTNDARPWPARLLPSPASRRSDLLTTPPRTRRTPEELGVALTELARVDWARVWRGYSEDDPREWSARLGWQLRQVDPAGNLLVRLGSGAKLYLRQDLTRPHPLPVVRGHVVGWILQATRADDNPGLFVAAVDRWTGYLDHARRAIGEPDTISSWSDPAFPDLRRWTDREQRLQRRSPYRIAVWSFPDACGYLYLAPSDEANSPDHPGTIQLVFGVQPIT